MSESMIERVARAIWGTCAGSKIHPWEHLGELREEYRARARAAIEAMREPTKAMHEAYDDIACEGHEPNAAFRGDAWEAAIEVALADPKP